MPNPPSGFPAQNGSKSSPIPGIQPECQGYPLGNPKTRDIQYSSRNSACGASFDSVKTCAGNDVEPTAANSARTTAGNSVKTTAGNSVKTTAGNSVRTNAGNSVKSTAGNSVRTTAGNSVRTRMGAQSEDPVMIY